MKKILGLLKKILRGFKKELMIISILGLMGLLLAKYIIKHHPQQTNLALTITMPIALVVFTILVISLWENINPYIFHFLNKNKIVNFLKKTLKNIWIINPIVWLRLMRLALFSITGKKN